ncbi:BON domain-containing protein [Leptolyngbya sp. FACHB-261]|uniref:BON domain-containing protein n=1 Tax=Leptolyngbya sp. FACHB-261 TaxID=2692806 RepID=UPI00168952CD|nr:BON domain-containing protein [Leptolyngbya sp. FACHB-261]MBD2099928.1 BON domain-containing protein [Leptolyngbya sp. FACHB-261]
MRTSSRFFGAIAQAGSVWLQPAKLLRTAVTLLCIAVLTLGSTLPATASVNLAAFGAGKERSSTGLSSEQIKGLGNSTQPRDQKALNENLRVSPASGQYSGLETVNEQTGNNTVQQQSDTDIVKAIKSKVGDDVVVQAASGQVILSGSVKDAETGRKIVEQVREVPGVRQITFEFGLTDRPNDYSPENGY